MMLYSNDKNLYKYNGYTIINDEVYMFFDFSNYNIQIQELYHCINSVCLVLIDEIVNHQTMCGLPIGKRVTDFFFYNKELGILLDEQDNIYESPVVVYCSKTKNLLEFTGIFGQTKSENDAIAGPFYYFTSFLKANEMAKKIECGGGIVRFALFLGNIKVSLNLEKDNIDTSIMKSELLKETNNDLNSVVRQSLRLSDHDGNWTQQYDSFYIGKLELDNGMIFPDGPMWVTHNYDQQIPLSFHYVNNYGEIL